MEPTREWHYALAGQKAGPVSEAELRRLFGVGVITSTTLVWTPGWTEWQPLGMRPGWDPPPLDHPLPMNGSPSSTEGTAIAAVVCGALGLTGLICCATSPVSIVAVVLGHMAMARTSPDSSSRPLALVGLVLGYLGIAFLVVPWIAAAFWGGWIEEVPGLIRKFQRGSGI